MNGIQYQYGKNDLFAVVIAFRYLIPGKDFQAFKRKLSTLIEHASKNLVHIDTDGLLNRMGFPSNWKNITRYRLPHKNILFLFPLPFYTFTAP